MHNHVSSQNCYSYNCNNKFKLLNLHALQYIWFQIDTVFVTGDFLTGVLNFVHLLWTPSVYRLLPEYFTIFHISCSYKNCLSARCASGANLVFRDVTIFRKQAIKLNKILHLLFKFFHKFVPCVTYTVCVLCNCFLCHCILLLATRLLNQHFNTQKFNYDRAFWLSYNYVT